MTTQEITIDRPSTTMGLGANCNVILYNDEDHSMDEVAAQLMKATGCSMGNAMAIMLEAHNKGRAVAFSGHRERCEHVAAVLGEIGLGTDIEEV